MCERRKTEPAICLRNDHSKKTVCLDEIPYLRGEFAQFPINPPFVEQAAQLLDRPFEKACSSADSVAAGVTRSFFQSGLPVNNSASHHTSPASSASRSVSDIVGRARRAQLKMGRVSQFRPNDMLNFRPMYSPMIMSPPLTCPSLGDRVRFKSRLFLANVTMPRRAISKPR